MKNQHKGLYKQLVEKASDIRIDIDSLWSSMRKLGNLFEWCFHINYKTFSLIHNTNYYSKFTDGEYARIYREVKRISKMIHYLHLLKMDARLNAFFADEGIEVKIIKPIQIQKFAIPTRIEKQLKEELCIDDDYDAIDKIQLAQKFLSMSSMLQGDICDLADLIKENEIPQVQKLFKIKKPHFVRAVRIRSNQRKIVGKQILRKFTSKNLTNVNQDVKSINDSITIFKNEKRKHTPIS